MNRSARAAAVGSFLIILAVAGGYYLRLRPKQAAAVNERAAAPPATPDATTPDAASTATQATARAPRPAALQEAIVDGVIAYAASESTEAPGVFEIDEGGHIKRCLTDTPANSLRWSVPGKELVFLSTSTREVRVLDVATTQETIITTLPARATFCGNTQVSIFNGGLEGDSAANLRDDSSSPLHVEEQEGARVENGVLKLLLQDRNDNMVTYRAGVAVNLTTGQIEIETEDPYECAHPDGDDEAEPTNDQAGSDSPMANAAHERKPTEEETQRAEREHERTEALTARLRSMFAPAKPAKTNDSDDADDEDSSPSWSIEQMSPSGRWALLSTSGGEGDYIYRLLWLVDMNARRAFYIPKIAYESHATRAPWPSPITFSDIKDAYAVCTGDGQTCDENAPASKTTSVAAETHVQWLPNDTLIIDATLVVPGREVLQLSGELLPNVQAADAAPASRRMRPVFLPIDADLRACMQAAYVSSFGRVGSAAPMRARLLERRVMRPSDVQVVLFTLSDGLNKEAHVAVRIDGHWQDAGRTSLQALTRTGHHTPLLVESMQVRMTPDGAPFITVETISHESSEHSTAEHKVVAYCTRMTDGRMGCTQLEHHREVTQTHTSRNNEQNGWTRQISTSNFVYTVGVVDDVLSVRYIGGPHQPALEALNGTPLQAQLRAPAQ